MSLTFTAFYLASDKRWYFLMTNFIKTSQWNSAAQLSCESDLQVFAARQQCSALCREENSCYQKLYSTAPASMADTPLVPASKHHRRRDSSWWGPAKADLSEPGKSWIIPTVVNITRSDDLCKEKMWDQTGSLKSMLQPAFIFHEQKCFF